MEKYKILITSKLGATLEQNLILSCDLAAVRRGQQLTAPGETLEVWRMDECVFRSEDSSVVSLAASKLARQ